MTVTVEFAPSATAPQATTATRPARRVPAAVRSAPVRPVRSVPARSRVGSGAPACAASGSAQPVAASSAVQLTRRGWALLVAVSLAAVAVLAVVAFLSHPAGSAAAGPAPTQVTVQAGDTLWSIATRIAPDRDPRAVVYDLQQVNHLSGATVVEGQVLRVG